MFLRNALGNLDISMFTCTASRKWSQLGQPATGFLKFTREPQLRLHLHFDFTSSSTHASHSRHQRRPRRHPQRCHHLPCRSSTTQQRSVQRCPLLRRQPRVRCSTDPTTSARVHRAQDREMPSFYSSSTLHERTGVLGRDFPAFFWAEKSPVSDTRASKCSVGSATHARTRTSFLLLSPSIFTVALRLVRTSIGPFGVKAALYTRSLGGWDLCPCGQRDNSSTFFFIVSVLPPEC